MNIWNDESKIRSAVECSVSNTETILKLGMNPRGSVTRKKLTNAIIKFDIDTSHFMVTNSKTRWANVDLIREAVAASKSVTDVLVFLGLTPRSGNFTTAQKYITQYKIDTSHFDPIQAGMDKKIGTRHHPIPLIEILNGEHPSYRTYNLKQRLLSEGILDAKCSICGITEWNGTNIVFDLDHINGVNNDHRRENLRLVCPNCHSQTPTYKGRNIKNGHGS